MSVAEDILNDRIKEMEKMLRERGTKITELNTALVGLVEVIEAHDLASRDCDRRGDEWCECLNAKIASAKKVTLKL